MTQKNLQYGSLAVKTTEIRMTILIPRQQIEVLSKRLWHGNYVAVEPAYQQLQQDLNSWNDKVNGLVGLLNSES